MFKNIHLNRPLAVIDLETTGTDPQRDRIVEVSIMKIFAQDRQIHHTWRVNPDIPIPAEATAIHGITDTAVINEPRFEHLADTLLAFLDGCDLCGFNLKRFDLKLLCCELKRSGKNLTLDGRSIIDPMEIFHHYEPRDLAGAVRTYLGREPKASHSAASDVLATAEVLDAMLARYSDLPRTVAGLHQHFTDPDAVDSDGFFRRVDGEISFIKGKYRGKTLASVAKSNPHYLSWMLAQDLFDNTKEVVGKALASVPSKVESRQ
jgi:DNA polymerase-3 subunit epsilon